MCTFYQMDVTQESCIFPRRSTLMQDFEWPAVIRDPSTYIPIKSSSVFSCEGYENSYQQSMKIDENFFVTNGGSDNTTVKFCIVQYGTIFLSVLAISLGHVTSK